MKVTIKFCIFKLIEILNFSFDKQSWLLEQIFKKKYTSGRKCAQKMNITIEFFIFELA